MNPVPLGVRARARARSAESIFVFWLIHGSSKERSSSSDDAPLVGAFYRYLDSTIIQTHSLVFLLCLQVPSNWWRSHMSESETQTST
jgi:hypothetical protein